MNEQLQTERKSNLDAGVVTTKLSPVDLGTSAPSTAEISRFSFTRVEAIANAPVTRTQPSKKLPSPQVVVAEPLQIDKNIDLIFATIELPELKIGKGLLDIQHRHEPKHRHKPYYSTRITNRSTEKIRIDRFSTYVRKGKVLVLHSLTGGFFSAQQFQEWYDLDRNRWIEPGQTVIDPNNHSNLGVYWAYFGTTASGREFTAAATWNGAKPWWKMW